MENKKGIIILIVILALTSIASVGYIVYDKIYLPMNDNNKKTTIDDVSIDLNALYQIGNTLNTFDETFNDSNSVYLGYIYNHDKLMASKFDNNAAVFAALHSDMEGTTTAKYILNGQVKSKFEKMFGKNLPYKPASINAGTNYNIIYNESSSNYAYTAPIVNTIYQSGYIASNINTTLENDKIVIKRRVFYVEYPSGETNITKVSIYKDSNKKKLIGTVSLRNNILSEKEVIAKYGSRLGEYKYTFKQNSSEDDYCFYSIEKLK